MATCNESEGAAGRAEGELRLFKVMIDAAGEEAYLVEPDGRLAYVNKAAAQSLGYTVDEMLAIGMSGFDPVFGPRYREHFEELKRGDIPPFETTHITKDGGKLRKEIKSIYLRIGEREYVCGFGHDVTRRKAVEDSVRDSEARLRSVIDAAPFGAHLYELLDDDRLVFTGYNRSAEQILGVPHQGFPGRAIEELFPPLSNTTIPAAYRQVARSGVPYEAEQVTYNEGGIRGVFEVHAIQTAPMKAAVFFRDITERKRAEDERLEMERRLRHAQKLESLGVMAGGIAHDFNNLLTAIMGNINLALMDVPRADPVRQCLEDAEKATHHAADLVRQILVYSGKAPFPVRSLDLRETIEEMMPMLRVSISKKVSLECAFGEGVPRINADPAQIRQVVMNLVINASEAVGDQEGVIRLSTGVAESTATEAEDVWVEEPATVGRCVCIQVADSGCGIQPDDLGRLFDPFYTTKFAGRGLGLSAVIGVVRGYRGGIRVACRPGRGARFTVVLPVARRPVDKAGQASNAAEPSSRGAGLILLVDDEEAIRSIGQRLLERMGFDVLTASDGAEAVEVFTSRGADIACVLLDLTMPRMDGAAAFREIRKIRPDAKVLLCSGYSGSELSSRFAGLGLSGFVQKPYTPTALRAALGRVLA